MEAGSGFTCWPSGRAARSGSRSRASSPAAAATLLQMTIFDSHARQTALRAIAMSIQCRRLPESYPLNTTNAALGKQQLG